MINEQEINRLIAGCRSGNRKDQEMLYRNFYRSMMSLCLRYTRNEHDALEALNAGFYKVFKAIGAYDAKKGTVYTWIRTIIINSCLDHIKSKSGQATWQELDQAAGIDLSPDVFSKLSSSEILNLVRQLPPVTRAVFNLYVLEGYTHKEIGNLINISDGTSKWHLNNARTLLKDEIIKMNKD